MFSEPGFFLYLTSIVMIDFDSLLGKSYKIIDSAYSGKPLNLMFSGGKDSVLLYDVMVKHGVPFNAYYLMSGIDPPGLKSFIFSNFPNVTIINPPLSFFQLVEKKGLPSRFSRFCCWHLREYFGAGKRNVMGVRWAESPRRGKYEPVSCDSRPGMKGAVNIFPIIHWSDFELWKYLHLRNLQTPVYYHSPYFFKRVGCVGCPLAGATKQQYEFSLFPAFARALVSAIKRNMVARPDMSLNRHFSDAYQAFFWYISGVSIPSFLEGSYYARNSKKKFFDSFSHDNVAL